MKKPLFLCALCVLAAALIMLLGWNSPTAAAQPHRHVALLTQDDTGSFFLQLRQGAAAAAAEQGDELTLLVAEGDVESQLRQCVREGAEGLLLYCPDDALARQIIKVCEGLSLPLTLLERTEAGCSGVVSDASGAGRAAAGYALANGAEAVTILAGSGSVAKARLDGAQEALGDVPCTVFSSGAALPQGAAGWVLCLSELRTAELLEAGIPAGVQLVGMDPGDARTTALESGAAQALMLPDPYAIGWSGMRMMQSLLGSAAKETKSEVEMRLCSLQNLYNEENVRCAFPLLQ